MGVGSFFGCELRITVTSRRRARRMRRSSLVVDDLPGQLALHLLEELLQAELAVVEVRGGVPLDVAQRERRVLVLTLVHPRADLPVARGPPRLGGGLAAADDLRVPND